MPYVHGVPPNTLLIFEANKISTRDVNRYTGCMCFCVTKNDLVFHDPEPYSKLFHTGNVTSPWNRYVKYMHNYRRENQDVVRLYYVTTINGHVRFIGISRAHGLKRSFFRKATDSALRMRPPVINKRVSYDWQRLKAAFPELIHHGPTPRL